MTVLEQVEGIALPRLAPGIVHVWRVDLDHVTAGGLSPGNCLSVEETVRAARLRSERSRARFVACRDALRHVLAAYLNVEPSEVSLATAPLGKPLLSGAQEGSMLQFNLSHSAGLALIAIGVGEPVGVDVELQRPLAAAGTIASSAFSVAEYREWMALNPGDRQDRFYRLWTRKEAVSKAAGTGLSQSLAGIEFVPGRTSRTVRSAGPPQLSGWYVTGIDPAPRYTAALATRAEEVAVCTLPFPPGGRFTELQHPVSLSMGSPR